MTPEQVAEVLAARTPGPWEADGARIFTFDDVRLGVQYLASDAAAISVAINLADEWQVVAEAARRVSDLGVYRTADPGIIRNRERARLALRASVRALDKKRESL